MKSRNSSVELLRCILMAMICLGHCRRYGIFAFPDTLPIAAITLTCRWHVDSFVAISGWFGIRFRWSKVVRLIGVFVFYSLLSWVFNPAGFSIRAFRVSGGWFGGTYLMLMFMAPIINAGIESVINKSPIMALCAWSAFAAGMFLNWLPYNGFSGCVPSGGGSHTILTMVFVYVTARLIALAKNISLERRILWCAIPVVAIMGLVGGGIWLYPGITWDNVKWLTDYNSPITLIFAISIVILFVRKVNLPLWLNRGSAFLAPSMFGVYLLHDTTSFGHTMIQASQAWLQNKTFLGVSTVIVLSAMIVFALGIAVDLFRRAGVALFRNKLNALLSKVDDGWSKVCGGGL